MIETIAFFDAKAYDIEFFQKANQKYNFEIKYFETKLNCESAALTKGSDAICIFVNDKADANVISALLRNKIKIIALRSAGFNNVDLKALKGRIPVLRVPEYSPHAVAEHAVGLMLALNRKYHKAYNRTRDGNFALNGLIGFDLFGKTAGIIGTGKIGKALTGILAGFGMKVYLYDIFPDFQFAEKHKASYTELGTIFKECDIISLNAPLTSDTYHLINESSINAMKDGVMIINTGRGGLINTGALIEGLKNKKVGFAGLDVYEEEENYFFEDLSSSMIEDDALARLLSFNNVIVTSHQGFFTKEALTNIAEITLNNIREYLDTGSSANEVKI